jgi:hypothetical protein
MSKEYYYRAILVGGKAENSQCPEASIYFKSKKEIEGFYAMGTRGLEMGIIRTKITRKEKLCLAEITKEEYEEFAKSCL